MKSVSCFYLFLIWVIIRKNIPSFPQTMNRGGNKYVPKCNHTFYWHPPSMMQLRVSHYYSDVILHFTKSIGMNKPDRYLPMRESELVALLSMVDEINKQIKKTKKIARKRDSIWVMKVATISHKFPCHPCRKKGQTNILQPAVILMILRVEAVEGPSMGKGGGKKPKLAKKKKAKNKTGERK